MSLKNTQTEKNLLQAFAGESQAYSRYSFYATKARQEGLIAISRKFAETAQQELEHGKRFFSFLEGGMVKITASFPAGKIGTTLENLQAAAMGEHEEYSMLYPSFAKIARTEGFEAIANLFTAVAVAEQQHEYQFIGFAEEIKNQQVFTRNNKIVWRCLNCGYIHEGMEAPTTCPACAHSRAFFTAGTA